MRLILMSTITLGTILVFGSPTADAATPDQIDETFTLRAYPGRWILPAEGDSLIIPRVQLNDLAGDVWEVVVLKTEGVVASLLLKQSSPRCISTLRPHGELRKANTC